MLSGTVCVGLGGEHGIRGAGYEAHRRQKLKRIVCVERTEGKRTRRQNRIKDKMLAGEAGGGVRGLNQLGDEESHPERDFRGRRDPAQGRLIEKRRQGQGRHAARTFVRLGDNKQTAGDASRSGFQEAQRQQRPTQTVRHGP